MQKIWIIVLTAILLFQINACEENYIPDDNGGSGTGSLILDGINEDADDYDIDSTKLVHIQLNDDEISIDSAATATIDGSTITLISARTYVISGNLADGQLIVNTDDEEDVKIILNGVNITSSYSSALFIEDASKVIIYLAENSNNYLTDGATYKDQTDGEPNAALFSKADLSIYGTGSLKVTGNYADGISGKDGLIIQEATITIDAEDDGIRGKDYLYFYSGNFTINAGGDGLKSDNALSADIGYITIESGEFTVVSKGDALSAYSQVEILDGSLDLTAGGGSSSYSNGSAKGIKADTKVILRGGECTINSADDALHSNQDVVVEKASVEISSGDDGVHADASLTLTDCEIIINQSYEGIESKQITVNQSTVKIISSDDGFNATAGAGTESNDGSSLTINSGYICVNASGGDALDANGSIYINGGTVLAHGPSSNPEVGLDYNGICKVTGGVLLVSGTNSNMAQAPGTTSTQYSVLVRFSSTQSANTLVHLEDEDGNMIFSYAPVRQFGALAFSCPELAKGDTYAIYLGGTCSGTATDGYYVDGTCSGSELYDDFTISGMVTTLGSASGGGGGPGGFPGGF
ncbi:MAG: carbohydrate-binding domain-containing protein [Bacteroidales bacterium]|nr:carbohydrate-binding domain-containing protein [Bacteroidales bacterium]